MLFLPKFNIFHIQENHLRFKNVLFDKGWSWVNKMSFKMCSVKVHSYLTKLYSTEKIQFIHAVAVHSQALLHGNEITTNSLHKCSPPTLLIKLHINEGNLEAGIV